MEGQTVRASDDQSNRVVDIRAVRADALSDEERATWARIHGSVAAFGNPYFSPEFTRLAASTWSRIEAAVLRNAAGDPLGFFPFERGMLNLGRPVARILSDFQGVVVEPQVEWTVDDLLRGSELASLEFDHLLASQRQFAAGVRQSSFSPALDLSQGYDGYASDRRAAGSKIIKELDRETRRFERDIGPLFFDPDVRNEAVLDWIFERQSRRYESKGYINALALPAVRRLVEAVRSTHTENFAGLLSVLSTGNRIVAAYMGMRSRTVWQPMYSAHDPEFERYSPGLLLLVNMARSANDLGCSWIDLGKGEMNYKKRMANAGVDVTEGRVERRSLTTVPARYASRTRDVLRRSPLADQLRSTYRTVRDR
jgi:CelD/BcsL family acetyltransferase involved in cellulose biosynthesis